MCTKQGILISYVEDNWYVPCTKHRLPKKKFGSVSEKGCFSLSLSLSRSIFVFVFVRRKIQGEQPRRVTFFNTHFFPFTNQPLKYRNQPIRTRFACKQRVSQNSQHGRRQHADCRYLVDFLYSFSLLLALYAIMSRIAVHLFTLPKCMYTFCIYLSQTLPQNRVDRLPWKWVLMESIFYSLSHEIYPFFFRRYLFDSKHLFFTIFFSVICNQILISTDYVTNMKFQSCCPWHSQLFPFRKISLAKNYFPLNILQVYILLYVSDASVWFYLS